jgi:transcription elongation factor GreB
MSKAFTKDDADEPPLIPPRAPLPEGVPNYVTPRGLALLRAELAELEDERHRLAEGDEEDAERRRRQIVVNARLADLSARLARAEPVDPAQQPHDRVRFGAHVTLRTESGEERRFQIVGVDEANAAEGRVAFTAPIARAILGCEVGDSASLRTPRGEESLEILSIAYDAD